MINLEKLFDNFNKNILENNSENKILDFTKFSDKELFDYCKKVGFNARIWSRRFIAALPEVAKRRLYKRYGFCSIHEFAAKLAGISRNNVDTILRIDEKLRDMPKIKSLIAEKGLNKVRLVANIIKPETENFWAEKIENMTKSSLEIFVKEKFHPGMDDKKNVKNPHEQSQISMFDSETFRSQMENESSNEGTRNKKTFTIQIDDETEFELRKFKQQMEKDRKEPIDWNFTLKEIVKRANRSEKFNTENAIKTIKKEKGIRSRINQKKATVEVASPPVSRHIPVKIKHNLEETFKGHCAYPACNKPAEQIHHVNGFAVNRSHNDLIPLCKTHHSFVHQNSNRNIDKIFNIFKLESRTASH